MQATLVYNHNAGNNGEGKVEELKDALRAAGYEPLYKATAGEEDLDPLLQDVEGLVVSAGGDGTARAILSRLIGKENVHFTPLPMGTANNVCRNLGIEGQPVDILRRLHTPQKCSLDAGHLQAPWGEDYFFEGAGIGFFAEVLASYEPEKGKSVLRSLKSLVEILQHGFSRETILEMPHETVRDEFLLVEVLNTNAVGPHLKFAPDADPTDGLLHVVCIKAGHQEGYLQYLRGLLSEDLETMENVELFKVKELKIQWDGFPVHTDAEVHPPGFDYRRQIEEEKKKQALPARIRPYPEVSSEATLHLSIIPQAFSVWLPAAAEE